MWRFWFLVIDTMRNVHSVVEQDAEMIRLRILGDPNLMRELREVSATIHTLLSKSALLMHPARRLNLTLRLPLKMTQIVLPSYYDSNENDIMRQS